MSLIRISEGNDYEVDYDKDRGMYRVSIFEGNHFKDEFWFGGYKDTDMVSKTELITKLEAITARAIKIMGRHKRLDIGGLAIFMDKLIEKIRGM